MKKTGITSKFFGLDLFSRSRHDLLNVLKSHLETPDKTLKVFTPNPEQVIISRGRPGYRETLQQADVLIPDGIGLILASELLGDVTNQPPLSERIPGVEVVADLLSLAEQLGLKVLILGGRSYAGLRYQGQEVSDQSQTKSSKLLWLEGYDVISQPTAREEKKVHEVITSFKPDLVFVALGAPWQEEWVLAHQALLEKNKVRLVMVVGGAFDFLLRKLNRAPAWMRQSGLEWLHRLIQEPWRWKRQLRLVQFVGLTLKEMVLPSR